MIIETKEIFSAPWEVSTVTGDVINPDGDTICHPASTDLAHRIKHMPELYDALKSATLGYCSLCGSCPMSDATIEDLIEKGCELPETGDCPGEYWWKLLKKVRDGE